MVTGRARSSASTTALWSVVSDIEGWAERVPTVSSVTHVEGPMPPGPGSRFEVEQPGLPKATYEVTEWVEGSHFVWVSRTPGLVSRARHTVLRDGTGSRLDLQFDWDGFLAPLARRLGERKGREMLAAEAEALARAAEGG